MLEYAKLILEKVSFDHRLFMKEFRKIKGWMHKEERQELEKWCRSQFSDLFSRYEKVTK